MPDVGCPKCGQPLTDTRTHCPGTSVGSCWWGIHDVCNTIVDMRRPSHWIDFHIPRSTDAHEG